MKEYKRTSDGAYKNAEKARDSLLCPQSDIHGSSWVWV